MSRPPTPTPPLPGFTSNASSETHHFSSPPRSSTLPQKQASSKHHHLRHAPHRSHHRHHHRHEKSVPQSALERSAPNPFGDLIRGEWPRRRASDASEGETQRPTISEPHNLTYIPDSDGARETLRLAKLRKAAQDAQRKRQWEAVTRLRNRRQEGEAELKTTLTHLSDLSTMITRRLDYTYYALLTSFSHLTSSVNAFHALAQGSRDAHDSFVNQVGDVEAEAMTSVTNAGEVLDRQTERVRELQERMGRGKERVKGLGERLERVRSRVEEAKRRDGEERVRVGRRWRMLGGFVGFWMGVVLVGLVMRNWGPRPHMKMGMERFDVETKAWLKDDVAAAEGERSIAESSPPKGWMMSTQETSSGLVDAEATLRLLEEL